MSFEPVLPRWADVVVLPLVNLGMALLVAGAVVALIGQNPWEVLSLLVKGAFGSARGFSYTLYYTTTFIFTGLAVAVAAHGGLFIINQKGKELFCVYVAIGQKASSIMNVVKKLEEHGALEYTIVVAASASDWWPSGSGTSCPRRSSCRW